MYLQYDLSKLPCPTNNRDPFNSLFHEDFGALYSLALLSRSLGNMIYNNISFIPQEVLIAHKRAIPSTSRLRGYDSLSQWRARCPSFPKFYRRYRHNKRTKTTIPRQKEFLDVRWVKLISKSNRIVKTTYESTAHKGNNN